MHNNYYFLRQVSARLREQLNGFTLVSCFSQNKDEIVFEFNDAKKSFFIKADLQGDFSCLTFPGNFHRARKNSADLFSEAIMKKVIGVRQFENERSFMIHLEDDLGVLFKMHGNKSNVLLTQAREVISVFKNNLAGDMEADRDIDWSKEAFVKNIDQLEKLYFTFGKPVWEYLGAKDWERVRKTKALLEDPEYYIIRTEKKVILSLLPLESVIEKYDDPLVAINAFYFRHISENAFVREKNSIVSRLRNDIAQTQSWVQKTTAKLHELRNDEHYKAWGDLLMANLHAIEAGKESIDLDDFYHPGTKVTVRLDLKLSPQKNAERYYRKGKNQQIEITKLAEGLEARSKELARLQSELAVVEAATDIKLLRTVVPDLKPRQNTTTVSLPYRQFEFKGFRLWVGKDAKTNDELTLKYSFKEDLWLHVRDDSGSHVLLKHQAGKVFPKDVIEYAASIAAFFSKRKKEPLCAVIVTPKKFVRKRKGDPAGAVIVDREDVILVEPRNPEPRI